MLDREARGLLAADFSGNGKNAIQKVSYTHDAMIDQIIQNPWTSQGTLAAHFGYTPGWVSQVIASGSFQERMAERKNEIIDPAIKATIEERFKALIIQSINVLRTKLEASAVDGNLAVKVMEGAARALGYGARGPLLQQNNTFVVALPAKAQSSQDWSAAYNAQQVERAAPVGGPIGPAAESSSRQLSFLPSDQALSTSAVLPNSERLLKELIDGNGSANSVAA